MNYRERVRVGEGLLGERGRDRKTERSRIKIENIDRKDRAREKDTERLKERGEDASGFIMVMYDNFNHFNPIRCREACPRLYLLKTGLL